jgi:DNA-binding MarR family transcriptional regulator
VDDKSEKIVNEIGKLFETVATSGVFFDNIEVSFVELRTLLFIIKSNGCAMSDLTKKFNIPASTATGIVDRLVGYNYISRARDQNDRRKVILKATEIGLALHQHHREILLREMSPFLDSIKDESKDLLLNSLERVNDLLTIGSSH